MADLEHTDPAADGTAETDVPKSRRSRSKAAAPASHANDNESAGGSSSWEDAVSGTSSVPIRKRRSHRPHQRQWFIATCAQIR